MSAASARLRVAAWLLLAALAGATTMVVELGAVRLIGPWFGTSQTVWTNVIGVVLLALSLGYLLGGRLSTRVHPARALGFVLLAAALCAAALPFAASPVARVFLPEGLTLDAAAGLLRWGSLATSIVLFLPPALCLGCVSPLCTEVLDREHPAGAGLSGGRVLCASTLGSLLGTFATTFVLLPVWGLSITFACAAASLAALAFLVLWGTRARVAALVAGFALAPAVLPSDVHPRARADGVLLAERETLYQSARVVEFDAGTGDARRELQVNESFDSYQSVWVPAPGLIGRGSYYDLFALPPWWAGAQGRWSVCVLGLCAGTTWRVLDGTLPPGATLDAWGVELDPAIVELARQFMELRESDERRVFAGCDARVFLQRCEREFDQIVLDAYANQMEIPAHLCTLEFFELVRTRLAPGGFLCANVGAFGLRDPVVEALAGSAARGLDAPVLALQVPFSRNVVLFARREAELPAQGSAAWVPESDALRALARQIELAPVARTFRPGDGAVLTDDRCDMERRQAESIARANPDGRQP